MATEQPTRRLKAETWFLVGCAILAAVCVVVIALNAQDFAPLVDAVQEQLDQWEQEFEQMMDELRSPERPPG